jgi:dolichol-phosphate mannosyltransferase
MTDIPKKDFSIIVPVYFNEANLKKTFEKLLQSVIQKNPDKHGEIIFVDDGSQDGSFHELIAIKNLNPELVKIIKFTRNFGQVPAIIAGYELAKGQCVINISADLQDPTELINQMLDAFFNEKYEVVICSRESREETLFRRLTSRIFYTLMKKLSFQDMPQGGFDFILLSRKAAKFIVDNREANPFLQGQILWTGFKKKFIPYKRLDREIGKSRWTFGKKLKYLLDGILGYSYFPLRLMSIAGLLIALSGFIYAIIIVIARIYAAVPFAGWAPIMVVVLVLSGVQMLMLGIIGEYLWRTLDQVRNRKPYIIETIVE